MVFTPRDVDAFALLAADTRRLDGQVLLDRYLPGRGTDPPDVTDPAQAAVIHRAIGVLIDQGLLPEDAVGELLRRAAAAGRTLTDTAQHVLEIGNPRPDPDPAP